MDKASYFLKGFGIGNWKKDEHLSAVLKSIHDIHTGNLKPGFELVEKYVHSKDVKPEVYTYDPAFVDILFSNNIPALLKNIIGRELYLAHIQLRISYKGGVKSYMIWHRDTHVYAGEVVGNIPPAHKIIFYPTVDGVTDARLKVAPGSHRRVFGSKIIDYIFALISKKKTIYSSDSEFLLFNTELFHHVVPEHNPKGSFRLIYSFVEHDQLVNYNAKELIEMYKERLK